jgi:hypothetical protein
MCVIEKQTGPGEQEEEEEGEGEEEEEKSASKPRFHAQGWKKSFQGTPLTLIYFLVRLLARACALLRFKRPWNYAKASFYKVCDTELLINPFI